MTSKRALITGCSSYPRAWSLGGGQVVPGPELVATAIATALESDGTQLRWPVGQDAELIAAARTGTDYDEFVAGMRTVLNLDW